MDLCHYTLRNNIICSSYWVLYTSIFNTYLYIRIRGLSLAIAAELVSYMEETCKDDLIAPVFKLKDLTVLYGKRLNQLGTNISGRVHSTKLKDRILAYFPDIEAHKQGRDVVLIYNKDIGSALRKACEHDADDDAIHLAKAAKIVRRDMFKLKNKFNGSFAPHCQERSVPTSLLSLVAMVLCGPSIEIQSSTTLSQPILTIFTSC